MSEKATSLEKMPLVTAVINCHNGERFVKTAIDSVLKQTYPNIEFLFIDNASTDGTGAIAKSYGDKLKYHRIETLVPLPVARNIALRMASGGLVAFVDADDEWLPAKIEKQVPLFSDPHVGFVYTNCIYRAFGLPEYVLYSSRKKMAEGDITRRLLTDFSMVFSSLMFRREYVEKVGYMHESMKHALDYHLCFQLLGLSIAKGVEEPLAIFNLHGDNESLKSYQDQYEDSVLMARYFREKGEPFNSLYRRELDQYEYEYVIKRAILLPWKIGNATATRKRILESGRLISNKALLMYYVFSYIFSWQAFYRCQLTISNVKRMYFTGSPNIFF